MITWILLIFDRFLSLAGIRSRAGVAAAGDVQAGHPVQGRRHGSEADRGGDRSEGTVGSY